MKDDFEYHITFPAVKTYSSIKEPVIVLFGWAGCADRHLSKYSKMYEGRGYTTIRFVTSTSILSPRIKNQKKIYSMAEKVVELMQDMMFNEHPIFFHIFSNGGAMVYRYVSEILRNKHADEFQILGCIFDSSPARVSAAGFIRAATAITEGSIWWKYFVAIIVLIQTIFVSFCNSFFQIFTGHFNTKPLWSVLLEEPNMCPQLFLFSKADNICNWESIQEFADKREKQGVTVNTILWDDSAHVQHMVMHEEAYCCAACTFIADKIGKNYDLDETGNDKQVE